MAFATSLLSPIHAEHEGSLVRPIRDLEQFQRFVSGAGPTALLDLRWLRLFVIMNKLRMARPLLGFEDRE